MDGFEYEIRGTWLEDLGQDAVREGFRRLLENSTYYMLAKRCGLDPWDELMPDDFTGITNFNRLAFLIFDIDIQGLHILDVTVVLYIQVWNYTSKFFIH